MWPSFHRMSSAASPVSATMPCHVQPRASLKYLTRWSVMFLSGAMGSTTVEGACSLVGVCNSGGTVGL